MINQGTVQINIENGGKGKVCSKDMAAFLLLKINNNNMEPVGFRSQSIPNTEFFFHRINDLYNSIFKDKIQSKQRNFYVWHPSLMFILKQLFNSEKSHIFFTLRKHNFLLRDVNLSNSDFLIVDQSPITDPKQLSSMGEEDRYRLAHHGFIPSSLLPDSTIERVKDDLELSVRLTSFNTTKFEYRFIKYVYHPCIRRTEFDGMDADFPVKRTTLAVLTDLFDRCPDVALRLHTEYERESQFLHWYPKDFLPLDIKLNEFFKLFFKRCLTYNMIDIADLIHRQADVIEFLGIKDSSWISRENKLVFTNHTANKTHPDSKMVKFRKSSSDPSNFSRTDFLFEILMDRMNRLKMSPREPDASSTTIEFNIPKEGDGSMYNELYKKSYYIKDMLVLIQETSIFELEHGVPQEFLNIKIETVKEKEGEEYIQIKSKSMLTLSYIMRALIMELHLQCDWNTEKACLDVHNKTIDPEHFESYFIRTFTSFTEIAMLLHQYSVHWSDVLTMERVLIPVNHDLVLKYDSTMISPVLIRIPYSASNANTNPIEQVMDHVVRIGSSTYSLNTLFSLTRLEHEDREMATEFMAGHGIHPTEKDHVLLVDATPAPQDNILLKKMRKKGMNPRNCFLLWSTRVLNVVDAYPESNSGGFYMSIHPTDRLWGTYLHWWQQLNTNILMYNGIGVMNRLKSILEKTNSGAEINTGDPYQMNIRGFHFFAKNFENHESLVPPPDISKPTEKIELDDISVFESVNTDVILKHSLGVLSESSIENSTYSGSTMQKLRTFLSKVNSTLSIPELELVEDIKSISEIIVDDQKSAFSQVFSFIEDKFKYSDHAAFAVFTKDHAMYVLVSRSPEDKNQVQWNICNSGLFSEYGVVECLGGDGHSTINHAQRTLSITPLNILSDWNAVREYQGRDDGMYSQEYELCELFYIMEMGSSDEISPLIRRIYAFFVPSPPKLLEIANYEPWRMYPTQLSGSCVSRGIELLVFAKSHIEQSLKHKETQGEEEKERDDTFSVKFIYACVVLSKNILQEYHQSKWGYLYWDWTVRMAREVAWGGSTSLGKLKTIENDWVINLKKELVSIQNWAMSLVDTHHQYVFTHPKDDPLFKQSVQAQMRTRFLLKSSIVRTLLFDSCEMFSNLQKHLFNAIPGNFSVSNIKNPMEQREVMWKEEISRCAHIVLLMDKIPPNNFYTLSKVKFCDKDMNPIENLAYAPQWFSVMMIQWSIATNRVSILKNGPDEKFSKEEESHFLKVFGELKSTMSNFSKYIIYKCIHPRWGLALQKKWHEILSSFKEEEDQIHKGLKDPEPPVSEEDPLKIWFHKAIENINVEICQESNQNPKLHNYTEEEDGDDMKESNTVWGGSMFSKVMELFRLDDKDLLTHRSRFIRKIKRRLFFRYYTDFYAEKHIWNCADWITSRLETLLLSVPTILNHIDMEVSPAWCVLDLLDLCDWFIYSVNAMHDESSSGRIFINRLGKILHRLCKENNWDEYHFPSNQINEIFYAILQRLGSICIHLGEIFDSLHEKEKIITSCLFMGGKLLGKSSVMQESQSLKCSLFLYGDTETGSLLGLESISKLHAQQKIEHSRYIAKGFAYALNFISSPQDPAGNQYDIRTFFHKDHNGPEPFAEFENYNLFWAMIVWTDPHKNTAKPISVWTKNRVYATNVVYAINKPWKIRSKNGKGSGVEYVLRNMHSEHEQILNPEEQTFTVQYKTKNNRLECTTLTIEKDKVDNHPVWWGTEFLSDATGAPRKFIKMYEWSLPKKRIEEGEAIHYIYGTIKSTYSHVVPNFMNTASIQISNDEEGVLQSTIICPLEKSKRWGNGELMPRVRFIPYTWSDSVEDSSSVIPPIPGSIMDLAWNLDTAVYDKVGIKEFNPNISLWYGVEQKQKHQSGRIVSSPICIALLHGAHSYIIRTEDEENPKQGKSRIIQEGDTDHKGSIITPPPYSRLFPLFKDDVVRWPGVWTENGIFVFSELSFHRNHLSQKRVRTPWTTSYVAIPKRSLYSAVVDASGFLVFPNIKDSSFFSMNAIIAKEPRLAEEGSRSGILRTCFNKTQQDSILASIYLFPHPPWMASALLSFIQGAGMLLTNRDINNRHVRDAFIGNGNINEPLSLSLVSKKKVDRFEQVLRVVPPDLRARYRINQVKGSYYAESRRALKSYPFDDLFTKSNLKRVKMCNLSKGNEVHNEYSFSKCYSGITIPSYMFGNPLLIFRFVVKEYYTKIGKQFSPSHIHFENGESLEHINPEDKSLNILKTMGHYLGLNNFQVFWLRTILKYSVPHTLEWELKRTAQQIPTPPHIWDTSTVPYIPTKFMSTETSTPSPPPPDLVSRKFTKEEDTKQNLEQAIQSYFSDVKTLCEQFLKQMIKIITYNSNSRLLLDHTYPHPAQIRNGLMSSLDRMYRELSVASVRAAKALCAFRSIKYNSTETAQFSPSVARSLESAPNPESYISPGIISVEIVRGFFVKPRQSFIVRDMVERGMEGIGSNGLWELLMGEGKSSVIGPAVAADLVLKKKFVVNVVPDHMVKSANNLIPPPVSRAALPNYMLWGVPEKNSSVQSCYLQSIFNKTQFHKGGMIQIGSTDVLTWAAMYGSDTETRNNPNIVTIIDEYDLLTDPMKSELNIPSNPTRDQFMSTKISYVSDALFLIMNSLKTPYESQSPKLKSLTKTLNPSVIQLTPSIHLKNANAFMEKSIPQLINLLGPQPSTKELNNVSPEQFLKSTLVPTLNMTHRVQYGTVPDLYPENGTDSRVIEAIPFLAKDTPSLPSRFSDLGVRIGTSCASRILQRSLPREDAESLVQTMKNIMDRGSDSIIVQMFANDLLSRIQLLREDKEAAIHEITQPNVHQNAAKYFLTYVLAPQLEISQQMKQTVSGVGLYGLPTVFGTRLAFTGTPSNLRLFWMDGSKDLATPAAIEDADTKSRIHEALKRDDINTAIERIPQYSQSAHSVAGKIVHGVPNLVAFIDAGAMVLDVSNKSFAQILAKKIKSSPKSSQFDGVVYFNSLGESKAVGISGSLIHDISMLSPDRTFVYYDHAHTTGVDWVLRYNGVGILTLSRHSSFRDAAQAAFRMRQLGKPGGQTIQTWIPEDSEPLGNSPREIFERLEHKMAQVEKVKRTVMFRQGAQAMLMLCSAGQEMEIESNEKEYDNEHSNILKIPSYSTTLEHVSSMKQIEDVERSIAENSFIFWRLQQYKEKVQILEKEELETEELQQALEERDFELQLSISTEQSHQHSQNIESQQDIEQKVEQEFNQEQKLQELISKLVLPFASVEVKHNQWSWPELNSMFLEHQESSLHTGLVPYTVHNSTNWILANKDTVYQEKEKKKPSMFLDLICTDIFSHGISSYIAIVIHRERQVAKLVAISSPSVSQLFRDQHHAGEHEHLVCILLDPYTLSTVCTFTPISTYAANEYQMDRVFEQNSFLKDWMINTNKHSFHVGIHIDLLRTLISPVIPQSSSLLKYLSRENKLMNALSSINQFVSHNTSSSHPHGWISIATKIVEKDMTVDQIEQSAMLILHGIESDPPVARIEEAKGLIDLMGAKLDTRSVRNVIAEFGLVQYAAILTLRLLGSRMRTLSNHMMSPSREGIDSMYCIASKGMELCEVIRARTQFVSRIPIRNLNMVHLVPNLDPFSIYGYVSRNQFVFSGSEWTTYLKNEMVESTRSIIRPFINLPKDDLSRSIASLLSRISRQPDMIRKSKPLEKIIRTNRPYSSEQLAITKCLIDDSEENPLYTGYPVKMLVDNHTGKPHSVGSPASQSGQAYPVDEYEEVCTHIYSKNKHLDMEHLHEVSVLSRVVGHEGPSHPSVFHTMVLLTHAEEFDHIPLTKEVEKVLCEDKKSIHLLHEGVVEYVIHHIPVYSTSPCHNDSSAEGDFQNVFIKLQSLPSNSQIKRMSRETLREMIKPDEFNISSTDHIQILLHYLPELSQTRFIKDTVSSECISSMVWDVIENFNVQNGMYLIKINCLSLEKDLKDVLGLIITRQKQCSSNIVYSTITLPSEYVKTYTDNPNVSGSIDISLKKSATPNAPFTQGLNALIQHEFIEYDVKSEYTNKKNVSTIPIKTKSNLNGNKYKVTTELFSVR